MECCHIEGGLFYIGSGTGSTKHYFENKYNVTGVEANPGHFFDSIPIGLEKKKISLKPCLKLPFKVVAALVYPLELIR
ncbi:hypothetical protein ACFX2J_010566 [Malus domestica]